MLLLLLYAAIISTQPILNAVSAHSIPLQQSKKKKKHQHKTPIISQSEDVEAVLHAFVNTSLYRDLSNNIKVAERKLLNLISSLGLIDITFDKPYVTDRRMEFNHQIRSSMTLLSTKSFTTCRANNYDQALDKITSMELKNTAIKILLQLFINLHTTQKIAYSLKEKLKIDQEVYDITAQKVKSGEIETYEEPFAKAKLESTKISLANTIDKIELLIDNISLMCGHNVSRDIIRRANLKLYLKQHSTPKMLKNSLAIKKVNLEHRKRSNEKLASYIPEIKFTFDSNMHHSIAGYQEPPYNSFNVKGAVHGTQLYQIKSARTKAYNSLGQYRNTYLDMSNKIENTKHAIKSIKREIQVYSNHLIPAAETKFIQSKNKCNSGEIGLDQLNNDADKLREHREELIQKYDKYASLKIEFTEYNSNFAQISHTLL